MTNPIFNPFRFAISSRLARFITALLAGSLFFPALWGLEKDFRLSRVLDGGSDGPVFWACISGAASTRDGGVIVCDWKQNFVAKYDRAGRFVKTIGRTGDGPGDFKMPVSLIAAGKWFYLIDQGNGRIARFDENLDNLVYFKLAASIVFPGSLHPLSPEGRTFLLTPALTTFGEAGKTPHGRIVFTNDQFRAEGSFFVETPWRPGESAGLNRKDPRMAGRLDLFSTPVLAVDSGRRRVLATFVSPDNPIRFFLYDHRGVLIRAFQRAVDSAYRFNRAMFEGGTLSYQRLRGVRNLQVSVVCFFRGAWYVVVYLKHYKDVTPGVPPRAELRRVCLKFGGDGDFIRESVVSRSLRVLGESLEGELFCMDPDGEAPQLEIWRFVGEGRGVVSR